MVLVEDAVVVVVIVSSLDDAVVPPTPFAAGDTTTALGASTADGVSEKDDGLVTRAIRTWELLVLVLQLVARSPKPLR